MSKTHTGGWSENRSAEDALQAAQDGKCVLCMGKGAFWDRRCLCSRDKGAPIVITPNTLGNVWSIRDQLDADTNIHHGDDPEGAEVRAHMVAGGRARDMSAHVPSPYRYCRGLMEYRANYGVWCESVRHLWEMPFTGAEWEIIPLEKSKPECWDFAGQPGLILYRTGLCSPLCYRQNGGIMEYIDVHHHPEEKWYVSSDWAVEAPNKVQFREATREEVAKLPDLTDEQRKRYGIPKWPLNDAQAKEWCNHNPGKVVECRACEEKSGRPFMCQLRQRDGLQLKVGEPGVWAGVVAPCINARGRWSPVPADQPEPEPEKVRLEIASSPDYSSEYVNNRLFAAEVYQRGCVVAIEFECWPEAVRGEAELFTASNGIRIWSTRGPSLGLDFVCVPGTIKSNDGLIAQRACDTPADAEALAQKVLHALREFAAWCDEHYEASDQ